MPTIRNRYRVLRELSETSYGWVFECLDTTAVAPADDHSLVAVKQVSLQRNARMWANRAHEQMPDDPQREREVAVLLRQLGGHPNIVQYMDEFVEFGTLYFVMENCVDGDLHSYLSGSAKGSLSCLEAMSVLSQVASGLAFLHSHGLAHRDVSLENVFMHNGRCKLGDLGLVSRAVREQGGPHLLAGKKYYMAPEVAAGAVSYDPKAADIWSLGILLFILLTGSPLVPFASNSVRAFRAFRKVGVRQVMDLWGLTPLLWDSIIELLDGMLQVDPAKRLTVVEVLEHEAIGEWAASFSG